MARQRMKPTGKRYSQEKRKKILQEIKTSKNMSKVCRKYGVSRGTVYDWKKALEKPKKESFYIRFLKFLGLE